MSWGCERHQGTGYMVEKVPVQSLATQKKSPQNQKATTNPTNTHSAGSGGLSDESMSEPTHEQAAHPALPQRARALPSVPEG